MGDALVTAPWIGNLLAMGTLIFADAFGPASAMLEQALRLAKLSGNNRAIGNIYAQLATLSYAVGDLAACETRPHASWTAAGRHGLGGDRVHRLGARHGAHQARRPRRGRAAAHRRQPRALAPNTSLQFFLRGAHGGLR